MTKIAFLQVFEAWFACNLQMQGRTEKDALWHAVVAEAPLPEEADTVEVFCSILSPLLLAKGDLGRMFDLFDIGKSNYLYRRLYLGQPHRTRVCPEHKGKQGVLMPESFCPHGCGLSGWLPEGTP